MVDQSNDSNQGNGERNTESEFGDLTPRELMIAARAWDQGFDEGVDAGVRMMENDGPDDDAVNPYTANTRS